MMKGAREVQINIIICMVVKPKDKPSIMNANLILKVQTLDI